MSARRGLFLAAVTAAGLVAGWFLAQGYLARHRSALFSPRLRRRHAALGHLAGHPSPDALRLLHDYLAWERHPVLRRRARRVARELEQALA